LNLIDTAPGYESGYSEEIVGAALKGRRDGVFLIDKIDVLEQPVALQIEASLKRLKMEQTDCFVFHAVKSMEQWAKLSAPGGPMEELAVCIRAGKTRFRGISCHHPEVLRAAIPSGLCDVVMFPIGPFVDPRYVDDILPLARQHRVGSVCFKTFGAGKLLGDTAGYNQPLQNRPRGKVSSGGSDERAPTLPRLQVDECVRYTLTFDPDVALLGLSFPNEQDAAFAVAAVFKPMSAEELDDVRRRAADAMVGKGPCWWNP
jgi:aryl-alcohol dehydrogenase-like predicted oxidoreductase